MEDRLLFLLGFQRVIDSRIQECKGWKWNNPSIEFEGLSLTMKQAKALQPRVESDFNKFKRGWATFKPLTKYGMLGYVKYGLVSVTYKLVCIVKVVESCIPWSLWSFARLSTNWRLWGIEHIVPKLNTKVRFRFDTRLDQFFACQDECQY